MRSGILAALVSLIVLLASLPAGAVDLSITADTYGLGGLVTTPLIPGEKDTVTITVRAKIAGEVETLPPAQVSITAPDGRARTYCVELERTEDGARGALQWKAWHNGMYRVSSRLDPENQLAEEDEGNNAAAIDLPVVIAGRRPWFPWFGQREHLRWANIWAGGFNKDMVAHWLERGVMPLRWKYGNNYPKDIDENGFCEMYSSFDDTPGIAVDECGYYPNLLDDDAKIGRFVDCVKGMARAKAAHPDKFFFMWHCGSFYPEQAALYRKACDLVVLESYVSYYAPKGLYTESTYGFLDMKMLPARQLDMLSATGKGPQVITSIDLRPQSFNRGQVEAIVRHLRRTWPEMRGFGIFGGLLSKDATEEDRARQIVDEQFVDSLCFEYFVRPVVTILPGNVWVTRHDDGTLAVEAAVSNVGGMDCGPVEARFLADGIPVGTAQTERIPAGDSLLDNRVVLSFPWSAKKGSHRIEAVITSAAGATVLDSRGACEWYAG